jgi:hypothetical protein
MARTYAISTTNEKRNGVHPWMIPYGMEYAEEVRVKKRIPSSFPGNGKRKKFRK